MKRFRGGLVFKAHRLLYHSTLGLRLIKTWGRRYGGFGFRIVADARDQVSEGCLVLHGRRLQPPRQRSRPVADARLFQKHILFLFGRPSIRQGLSISTCNPRTPLPATLPAIASCWKRLSISTCHPRPVGDARLFQKDFVFLCVLQGHRSMSPPRFQGACGRCKATWKREFKLPWREAGPPNNHDDKVVSDQ